MAKILIGLGSGMLLGILIHHPFGIRDVEAGLLGAGMAFIVAGIASIRAEPKDNGDDL